MMKKITIVIFQALICFTAASQNGMEQVLNEIENNNTRLQATRARHEALQLAHKTGIYPSNPEFEYAWFAGSPSTIGSKTNISLVQQFHFPSAYRHMNRIANARIEQLTVEYDMHRRDIRYEATLTCLKLIHTNAMALELDKRRGHAAQLADAYKKMLDLGETNLIEYNKARLNLLNLEKEHENTLIRQQKLLGELTTMNGGNQVILSQTTFPEPNLPVSFDQWYAQVQLQNPVLLWLNQEADISRREQQLQKAMNLPDFTQDM
jgi:outer membrane protein, heavy metal efflux system